MPKFQTSVNNILYNQPVTAVAGTAYTALQTDRTINITATAAFALTLPAPSANNVGQAYVVKDVAGNAFTFAITITPSSGLIDGAASFSLGVNYGSVTVFSDGVSYWTNAAIKIPSLMAFSAVAASQSVVGDNGYYVTAAATLTLPTVLTTVVGQVIYVTNVAGGFTIAQLATQQIQYGNSATTVGTGGSLASSQVGDSISFLAVTTAKWQALNAIGNLLVT